MSTTQPLALRLAAGLESIFISEELHATKAQAIAAELRRLHQSEREGWRHANELEQERKRLHAEIADLRARVQELGQMARDVNSRRVVELEAQLEAIGAGGVSGPLIGQPQAMPDLSALPALGAPFEGGTFAGVITRPDGTHVAVALLPKQGSKLTWAKARAWAKKQGGELPSRPIAAMLFANAKPQLRPVRHWTAEASSASYAWHCNFDGGCQYGDHKSLEGSAVAVRCIPIAPQKD